MPETYYSTNILSNSIFRDERDTDGDENTTEFEKMRITCLSGWRNENIAYHRGIDCNPPLPVPVPTSTGHSAVPFYAPEDGKFWTLDLGPASDGIHYYTKRKFIKIDDNNVLLIEGYPWGYFGDLGILVTNPENPRDGRIYIFAHIWAEECPNQEKVLRGEQIGLIGGAGDKNGSLDGTDYFPIHIHMEVYEFFPLYQTTTTWNGYVDGQVNLTEIRNIYYTNNGVDSFLNEDISDEDAKKKIEDNLRWQRVNGITVFNSSIIDLTSSNNDMTEAVITRILAGGYYENKNDLLENEEKFCPLIANEEGE